MLKDTKNTLLVKDDVGRSKPSTRDLPPENFAYGKCAEPDAEGVAQGNFFWVFDSLFLTVPKKVTRSWKFHDHSKDVMPEKDFKKLNALCVKKGVVKPKA